MSQEGQSSPFQISGLTGLPVRKAATSIGAILGAILVLVVLWNIVTGIGGWMQETVVKTAEAFGEVYNETCIPELKEPAPVKRRFIRPNPPPVNARPVQLSFGAKESAQMSLGSGFWVAIPPGAYCSLEEWQDVKHRVRPIVRRSNGKKLAWFQPTSRPERGEKIVVRIYTYDPGD